MFCNKLSHTIETFIGFCTTRRKDSPFHLNHQKYNKGTSSYPGARQTDYNIFALNIKYINQKEYKIIRQMPCFLTAKTKPNLYFCGIKG